MLSAAGSLRWLRDALRRRRRFDDAASPRRRAWEPGVEGLLFLPVPRGRAHAARRPRRARRVRRPRRCATTAARSRARCSRASPSACATRSTSSASWAGARARRASPAAARAATLWLRDRRLGARTCRSSVTRGRRGRGVRRRAARRRRGGRVARRARGGRRLRAGDAHDRAAAGLGRALRRGPAARSGASTRRCGRREGADRRVLCGVRRRGLAGDRRAAFCMIVRYSCGRMAATTGTAGRGAPRGDPPPPRAARGRSAPRTWRSDLGVSLDTIRRDLAELAAAGALRRVHGGALPPASPGPWASRSACPTTSPRSGDRRGRGRADPPRRRRRAQRRHDDARGRAPAARRPRGDRRHDGPDIAVALADHPGLTVDVVGGRLHPQARTVTGPEAVEALRTRAARRLPAQRVQPAPRRRASRCATREEAAVVRAMVEGAGRVAEPRDGDEARLRRARTSSPAPTASTRSSPTPADDDVGVYRELGIEVVRA